MARSEKPIDQPLADYVVRILAVLIAFQRFVLNYQPYRKLQLRFQSVNGLHEVARQFTLWNQSRMDGREPWPSCTTTRRVRGRWRCALSLSQGFFSGPRVSCHSAHRS